MVAISTSLYVVISILRELLYGTSYVYDEIRWSSGGFVDGMMDMASRAGYFVAAFWILQAVAGGSRGGSNWVDCWVGLSGSSGLSFSSHRH
jgi:hypothetical protein